MFTEGIKIFLSLLKPDFIEKEYSEFGDKKKQTKLSQSEILDEIINALNKFKSRPDFDKEIVFEIVRTLIKFKKDA